MELRAIGGKISKAMELIEDHPHGKFEYIKGDNFRDVVTEGDLEIHRIMQEFCDNEFPISEFISEEGEFIDGVNNIIVKSRSVMLVDPLDGSNNLVCGLRDYGFMACILEEGIFKESLVVLPGENQILDWSAIRGLSTSRKFESREFDSASTYLAYAPSIEPNFIQTRAQVWNILDQFSSGLYRYGSACVGLYRTLIGSHSTFIGIQMRPWDVLAFLPIMESQKFRVSYSCSKDDISVVISTNNTLFDAIEKVLTSSFGEMIEFRTKDGLRVTR
jgi:myo-inositol-1(or 4)-monophosphatase